MASYQGTRSTTYLPEVIHNHSLRIICELNRYAAQVDSGGQAAAADIIGVAHWGGWDDWKNVVL